MQNSSVEMETSRNDDRTTDTTLPPGRVSGQEAEAIANAVERMAALGIDPNAAVYVDDENRCPSYARRIGTAWGRPRTGR